MQASMDLYVREREKADEIAVMSAVAQYKEIHNKSLYDPKEGALNKKGQDALSIYEPSITDFKSKGGEIEGTLQSDRQKIAFRRAANALVSDFDLSLQRHVAQESANYDKSQFELFIKGSQDKAAFNYQDPMMIAAETEGMRAAAAAFASRNGLSKEWVERFTTDTVSNTHKLVIERMLANGDDMKAKQYYNAVAPAIAGKDAADIEKAVEAGSLRGESQRWVDGHMYGKDAILDEADIMVEVRKIKDPKLRDAVTERVGTELARRERMQNEGRERISVALATQIDRGMTISQIRGTLEWQQLTPGQRAGIESYAKQVERGQQVDTDWPTFYELMTMASTETTRNRFLATDLMNYRGKLHDNEFKQLTTLQAQLRQSVTRTDTAAMLQGYRTTAQIVNDTLTEIGLDPTPKQGSTEAARVAQFRRMVDEQIILFKQQNNGRAPSDVEIQGFVDNMLTRGKVKGSGVLWDDTMFAFEAPKDKEFIVSPKDVPPNERRKIEAALKRNGKPATDKEIMNMYNLRLRRFGVPAPIPPVKRDLGEIPNE